MVRGVLRVDGREVVTIESSPKKSFCCLLFARIPVPACITSEQPGILRLFFENKEHSKHEKHETDDVVEAECFRLEKQDREDCKNG